MMRDCNPEREQAFFELFREYYDLEKNVAAQHDPASYTLDRMTPLAELAGHPERKFRIIHVAGTKGKGSTSHFISALLESAGRRTGLFTSPHVSTVRERFQIDNRLISYDELESESRELLASIRRAGLTPSLFEIFTVLALKIFADSGVDDVVLETGIGGTLDATNYVPEVACNVITPVSFDHMALLGNTIVEIAAQKAGIIREGVPLVMSRQPYEEAEKIIRERAAACHAGVFGPAADAAADACCGAGWAPFLKENFHVAWQAVAVLGETPVMSRFRMPMLRARCETVCRKPLVVLDGAHNADSMKQLVIALKELYPLVRFTVVLGTVAGKDVRGICRELAALHAPVILTNPHTPKASALDELRSQAREAGLTVMEELPELTCREQLPADTPLVFTGSFFTAVIGEALFSEEGGA